MTEKSKDNQDRLFTWTQLYELTRLPAAPKKKVGRPLESAFPRKLMGIYLSVEEKESLLAIQKELRSILQKKPSYGEVLGILSRLYSMTLEESPVVLDELARGHVRHKERRVMVAFKVSDGERRLFLEIQEALQAAPEFENYSLSYGDVFVIMAKGFKETMERDRSLEATSSFIEFSQRFVDSTIPPVKD
jgi:hypothetical protein